MSNNTVQALSQRLEQHAAKAREELGDMLIKMEWDSAGIPILWVKRDRLIEALRIVKETDGLEYHFMTDLTCYDDGPDEAEGLGRFVVVYQLYSPQNKTRLRLKTRAADGQPVPTATALWNAANWAEREVYDMFGVKFEGHPDLRRILMDVRWQGHPLRKEYPLRKRQLFNDPEPIPEHLLKD